MSFEKHRGHLRYLTIALVGNRNCVGMSECIRNHKPEIWLMFWSLGKKLSDFERVTSLKVYNWFANRRKEIKRRANIGKVLPLFLFTTITDLVHTWTFHAF